MADKTKIDKAEVKKIKDFLKEKSKMSSVKVDAISDDKTERSKVVRAVLREHGMSEEHISKLSI